MRALIIFESMYGNTERVARAIAEGLQDTYDVTVADVSGMPRAGGVDLLVAGGPTHAFSLSRPSTRADAARQGTVRADAVAAGLRSTSPAHRCCTAFRRPPSIPRSTNR